MLKKQLVLAWSLVAAAALSMGGCGNGGDDAPPPPPPPPPPPAEGVVPPEALASVQAFVAFLQSLLPDDTAEPLQLNGAVPPTSDTDEPVDFGG
jgi:hypothetical protein